MLNDYLKEEDIDILPIIDIAKEFLRIMEDPKKIHAVSLVQALTDIQETKEMKLLYQGIVGY